MGAVLGLAVGAAMALTQGEEQTVLDEQDFNEFLAQAEAEEEEHNFQQTM